MDERIREGIEACRPGSADLQSPQFQDVARAVENDVEARALYQRVQRWDANIAAAMDDVPVPAGLAARLLVRLQVEADLPDADPRDKDLKVAGTSALGSAASDVASVSTAVKDVTPAPARGAHSRRRWLAISLGTAASLLAAWLGANWWLPPADTSLEAMADRWQQDLTGAWQDVRKAPADFPVSNAVAATAVGWQRIGKFAAGRGVAYKLVDGQGATALLYVVRISAGGLPVSPPVRPQSTTAGKAVGYWQSGGLVYVLVVDPGNERSYRGFVTSSSVPLA